MNSERTRFFRSIRFRLTAWYALILFIIILMLGAGVAKVWGYVANEQQRRLAESAALIDGVSRVRNATTFSVRAAMPR